MKGEIALLCQRVLRFQTVACFVLPFVLSVAHVGRDRNSTSPRTDTHGHVPCNVCTRMYVKMAFNCKEKSLRPLERSYL